jgi:dienelactone hydrolase
MGEPSVVLTVIDDNAGPFDPALRAALSDRQVRWVTTKAASVDGALAELRHAEPAAGSVVVVGVGRSGEAALLAAAETGFIGALVLIDAPLSPEAVNIVAEWRGLPVLVAADPMDRAALRGAVDAFLASSHEASDLVVGTIDESALQFVAAWLTERMDAPRSVDVTLRSSDDWELHATHWPPKRAEVGQPLVAGVVLLHSGRSDRTVFSRLERLLANHGFAVLNLDWRGRGQSTNRGTYAAFSAAERGEGWRDAAAAFDYLASCPGVDPKRLAAVGVIHGAEHAVRAANLDPRVRAIVILTGYRAQTPLEATYLTSGAVEVLYVTSAAHVVTSDAMRRLYNASTGRHTRFVEYPGGAIGYQLFDLDQSLEPSIVTWLREVLAP